MNTTAETDLIETSLSVDWEKLNHWCEVLHEASRILNQLGPNLKLIRPHLDVTQQTVAEAVEVSTSMIGQWEHGRRVPDVSDGSVLASWLMDTLEETDRVRPRLPLEPALQLAPSVAESDLATVEDIRGEGAISSDDIDIDQF